MAAENGFLIPEDLLSNSAGDTVVDKYEIAAGSASAGDSAEAYNYPIVHITSSGPRDHGGSLGFDASKPFSTVVRSPRGRFVVGDLSAVPKAQMAAISNEAKRRFDLVGGKNERNYSDILAQMFEENFACTLPDGSKLDNLNTWVNNGKDPFGREVRLPPPAIISKTRKAAMHNDGFVAHTSQMGRSQPQNPAMGVNPHYFPAFDPSRPMNQNPQAAQFGPPQTHSTHVGPQQGQQRPAAPAPVIPPPDKTVMFHLGAGTLTSAYHFVQAVNEEVYINGMNQVVTYVVLTRNMAAAGSGDNFVPQTPAPGANLHITLPAGEVYQVHSVILKFQIGKVHNTVLLVTPPTAPEPAPGNEYYEAEQAPQDELGQSAPISAEDAAGMM